MLLAQIDDDDEGICKYVCVWMCMYIMVQSS